MQHTEDTEINIKKEEDDIDIKKEDEEEEEDFDNTQHPDADVELLRVMKVEIVCNHLQPHIAGSTLSRPAFVGTPRCDKCGIFIHTERAHRCDLCGGTFCCRTNSARGANARVKKVARAKGLAAHTCRCSLENWRSTNTSRNAILAWASSRAWKPFPPGLRACFWD